jgi:hypothetical protein
VGTQPELMLPIVYSLATLIHPFEIQYCLPLIMKDKDQEYDESSFMIVTRPWPYLIGILERDLPGVLNLLENYNDCAAPMIYRLSTQKVSILHIANNDNKLI